MQATPPGDDRPPTADGRTIEEAVEPLRSDPGHAAVFCDLDGTLAPIVPRPEDAAVPEPTLEALRALVGRYALVGIVSGRRAADAREIVGMEELAYSGNHGFELLLPGDDTPRPDPSLDGHEQDAPRFVAALNADLERVGIRTEDKGAIVALHWRGAENEGAAEALASEIASDADWQGLVAHRGRKVLEIRPNVAINKGIAVAALVPARPITAALYGGDDRTDADAFAGLRALEQDGELDTAVCVAVASAEAPAEVIESADLVVDGPEQFADLLRALSA